MLAPKMQDRTKERMIQNAIYNGQKFLLLEQNTCIEQEKKELKKYEDKRGILSVYLSACHKNNKSPEFVQAIPKLTESESTESTETYFLKEHTIKRLNVIENVCQVYQLDEYHKTELSFKLGADNTELYDIGNIQINWEKAKVSRAKKKSEYADHETQVSKGKTREYSLKEKDFVTKDTFSLDNLDFSITVCLKYLEKSNEIHCFGSNETEYPKPYVPQELLKEFPSKEAEIA